MITDKHVDHKISPAARRLAILAAAIAVAGLLNDSGCSNPSATMAIAAGSPSAKAATPQLPQTRAGSATVSTGARRQTRFHQGFEGFDHLPAGTPS
jgi:hypothetical protein